MLAALSYLSNFEYFYKVVEVWFIAQAGFKYFYTLDSIFVVLVFARSLYDCIWKMSEYFQNIGVAMLL